MTAKEEFVPLEVQGHKGVFSKQSNHQTVIKGEDLVVGTPVKVGGLKTIPEKSAAERVEPLIKGEEIVGVRYHCNCGESVEIHFEFESSSTSADFLKTKKKIDGEAGLRRT